VSNTLDKKAKKSVERVINNVHAEKLRKMGFKDLEGSPCDDKDEEYLVSLARGGKAKCMVNLSMTGDTVVVDLSDKKVEHILILKIDKMICVKFVY